jgi:hypothetical protein
MSTPRFTTAPKKAAAPTTQRWIKPEVTKLNLETAQQTG